jgi:hypothetical protein
MTRDRAAEIIAGYEADMPLIGERTTKSLEWLAFAINEAIKAETLVAREEGRRAGIKEATKRLNQLSKEADDFYILHDYGDAIKAIRALANEGPT